jgi:hypothetical protein
MFSNTPSNKFFYQGLEKLYLQLVKEAVMNAIMNGAPPLKIFNFAIPADEQQYLVLSKSRMDAIIVAMTSIHH